MGDPDDSDSSLGDTIPYAETDVNLGYASKEPTGDTISHLGGYPTWLDLTRLPPATLGRCQVCQSTMSLLLLLNTDLPQHFPNDERRLHVFACQRRQCSRKAGSIRALREVKKHQIEEPDRRQEEAPASPQRAKKDATDLGSTLFGVTSTVSNNEIANPFSAAPAFKSPQHAVSPFPSLPSASNLAAKSPQSMQETPVESFASKLHISTPELPPKVDTVPEPWPPDSSLPKSFPLLYLDAEYETLVPEEAAMPQATSSKDKFAEEDANAPSGLDKDLFESSLDKTFVRFSDRLAQNPDQVLRYEWKGTPLLYSRTDLVGKRLSESASKVRPDAGIPACERCGSRRVFEIQLVPGAITALEEQIELEESMEWGTIIIGVCEQNCGQVGEVVFREEWCGVQWEETK